MTFKEVRKRWTEYYILTRRNAGFHWTNKPTGKKFSINILTALSINLLSHSAIHLRILLFLRKKWIYVNLDFNGHFHGNAGDGHLHTLHIRTPEVLPVHMTPSNLLCRGGGGTNPECWVPGLWTNILGFISCPSFLLYVEQRLYTWPPFYLI